MLDYLSLQAPTNTSSVITEAPFSQIISEVEQLKEATSAIPAMMRSDPKAFEKAWRTMSKDKPDRGPKSAFFDPLSLQYALGYKDRKYSLTYDTLKRMATQLGVVAAIVNTRIAQIAAFSQPYRTTKSLGYIIRHKDPEHSTTSSERRFIQQLESFIASCGEPGRENPYTRLKRPKFESFLKMIIRDTLIYDQVSFEIVPRNNGIPFEFRAIDASTIRLAAPSQDASSSMQYSYHQRNLIQGMTGPTASRFGNMYTGEQYGSGQPSEEVISCVQVVNGQIQNVYTFDELAFGVRNPRTDIYVQGYGFGELEQLITIITSLLYAEEYNRRFFMQGAHPKGILNFKGDNWTPDQLEAFKRQWIAQVAGTQNAWKTPITQSEGVEWINMQMTNQDMQFNVWVEYLLKVACAVFLIDPAEINFDLHGGVQQTPLFESSQEWKLKASRDRGLKPLLRFIAGLINEHVIDKIDDHFVFEFAGLDELTEQEKHEMIKEQIQSYMTLNEARRSLDLPDIAGGVGDLPLNPTLVQLLQFMDQKQQREDEADQQQQQAQQPAAEPPADPQQELKAAHAQQKIQQGQEKHPIEMEMLKQKLIQAGGQVPEPPLPQEGEEVPAKADNQPLSKYADLIGKASDFSLDDWITRMREMDDE